MPQKADGPRIDPEVSDPMVAVTRPAAMAEPEPEDEPPVKWPSFHGLTAGGNGRSLAGPPVANSCVASLPTSTMPASPRRAATVESAFGTFFSSTFECAVVRMPLVE